MPKFEVEIGRLVREHLTLVVEGKSEKDVENRLHEVYQNYEGGDWVSDDSWGCEESDSHCLFGKAKKNAKVDIKLD